MSESMSQDVLLERVVDELSPKLGGVLSQGTIRRFVRDFDAALAKRPLMTPTGWGFRSASPPTACAIWRGRKE